MISMNDNEKILSGVVFDLDGTLVDSAPDIHNALNLFLLERGRRGVTLNETKAALGDGVAKLLERILSMTGGRPEDFAADIHSFLDIYRAIKGDPRQIYPQVIETLQGLRAGGIGVGLCTNKPEAATLKLLDDLAIEALFDAVAGGDTFAVHKPHPDHLRGVIQRMNVPVTGCVMVGDSPNDLAAAHGLGIPCVLVDYGYGADIGILPAEAVIGSMSELAEALARLGFKRI